MKPIIGGHILLSVFKFFQENASQCGNFHFATEVEFHSYSFGDCLTFDSFFSTSVIKFTASPCLWDAGGISFDVFVKLLSGSLCKFCQLIVLESDRQGLFTALSKIALAVQLFTNTLVQI